MDPSSMYKEHILALWKEPENFGKLPKKTHEKRGYNESCGDDVTIQLLVENNKVVDVKFFGKGCALCMASSSLFTDRIKGMSVKDVMKLDSKELLKLLEIDVHPARLKCVLLPLETTHKVLKGE